MQLCEVDSALTSRAGPEQQQSQQQTDEAAPSSTSAGSSPDAPGSVRDTLRAAEQQRSGGRRRQADSTDWISSQLTRRFGLAGGLAWVGFLTFGVLSEQIKTRLEIASEEANTREVADAPEVVTPEGLRYRDLKIGGGSPPIPGYIVVLDYKGYANGELFEDTTARRKPIVFLYGKRPFSGGMCLGRGRRRVTIPPELGFGNQGLTLRPTEHVPEKAGIVPPGATLEYELSLVRVSIPPS
ncbi:hypothetical protein COHA_005703 [Chlorella ohadii]|uniref:peptidylprolyl isomerase n=1 Tax=Chlorella ohadii TaxID=2649997 RepID=A0AAD5DQH1_9CHLO|nr:hypothetical protein COHA_005703 [Chlorella ohadii]